MSRGVSREETRPQITVLNSQKDSHGLRRERSCFARYAGFSGRDDAGYPTADAGGLFCFARYAGFAGKE